MPFTVVANTMQALVKYHGMKDWKLRFLTTTAYRSTRPVCTQR